MQKKSALTESLGENRQHVVRAIHKPFRFKVQLKSRISLVAVV
jgi:hypothetical protein